MSLIQEIDFGTPASASARQVMLTIDGQQITVPEGTSIMRAAMQAGIKVPKLCATDSLDAFGSCRVCLVEIEGRPGTPASCTTPVTPDRELARSSAWFSRSRAGTLKEASSIDPIRSRTPLSGIIPRGGIRRPPWSAACPPAAPGRE